jgi:hypothetical protein
MSREKLQHEIDQGVAFWGYEETGKLVGVMGLQQVQDVTLIRHAYVHTGIQSEAPERSPSASPLELLWEDLQFPIKARRISWVLSAKAATDLKSCTCGVPRLSEFREFAVSA